MLLRSWQTKKKRNILMKREEDDYMMRLFDWKYIFKHMQTVMMTMCSTSLHYHIQSRIVSAICDNQVKKSEKKKIELATMTLTMSHFHSHAHYNKSKQQKKKIAQLWMGNRMHNNNRCNISMSFLMVHQQGLMVVKQY